MMAAPNKKAKSKSSGSPRSYSEIYKSSAANPAAVSGGTVAAGSAAAATVAAPTREVVLKSSDEVDWRAEYGYVVADLKRLGIVTAVIAGAIIVVGLFV
jgi:hypothetical protein